MPGAAQRIFFVGKIFASAGVYQSKQQKLRDKIALAGVRRWDRLAASRRLHRMAA
jgi:hypothetical protein